MNIGTAGLPKTYDHAPGYCGLTFWLTVIQLLLDLYFRKNACIYPCRKSYAA